MNSDTAKSIFRGSIQYLAVHCILEQGKDSLRIPISAAFDCSLKYGNFTLQQPVHALMLRHHV